jgi:Protein of unknown function (DUF4231)
MPETAKASSASAHSSVTTLPHHRHSAKDDMNDAAELKQYETLIDQGHHAKYRPLCDALSLVQATIHQPFTRCDKQALDQQKWYQFISIAAVLGGAVTILIAIFEFIFRSREVPLTWTEAVVAAVTLLLIGFGQGFQFKEKWLTARYKAENLRLLKFRTLTDSRLWCPPIDMKLLREELEDEVHRLEGHNYEKARAWASEGVHPRICAPPCEPTCVDALHELIDYYRPKRLHSQTEYLSQKAEQSERKGAWTGRVVRWLFFTSFAFVLTHLVLQWHAKYENDISQEITAQAAKEHGTNARLDGVVATPTTSGGGETGAATNAASADDALFTMILIGLAAALPVAAAGFRSYRGSREFERNALRHQATRDSLEELERQLRTSSNLNDKFRLLGFCELVLEMDCREFMRLLCEVEWYG